MSDSEGTPERPLLRVVRGDPTPEELAALVAVVAARASGGAEPEPERPSPWASKAAGLRRPLHPGPGAWVASARTR
ncbi:MAG TPA: acyl-CoA carboxylase subunit epsilon [Mycobacteriales bacterium]|nr:acyl-CoA carboxylase subunit epsilon [Mycobacteriales bacterium]